MNTRNTAVARTLAVAAFAALSFAPAAAFAQDGMPSYATHEGETIKGTIKSFDGAYTMYVRDVRGYVDNISLHQGTIINPTGIRLEAGYPVTITGHPSGNTFVADEIDTPFHPVHNYAYPYPLYAYPYAYPYPSFYGRWGWRR